MLGINPRSQESHRRFALKQGFPFPLIVDRGGRIARAFGCGGLIVRRTVYVLDALGRVHWVERGMPPVSRILEALP